MYKKGRNASVVSSPSSSGSSTPVKPYTMSKNPPTLVASSSSVRGSSASKNTPAMASSTTASKKPAAPAGNTPEDSPHPVPPAVLKKRDSQITKDLMISYSHADNEMMMKIRDALEDNGISVWVDVSGLQAGVDFLSKIGQAIIDCKLFLSLLSKASVKSKYCQDELALAYVSNRSIFPVTLDDAKELKPMMDTGMKLQLARYEWTHLGRDPEKFQEGFDTLIKRLKDDLLSQHADKQEEASDPETARSEKGAQPDLEIDIPSIVRLKDVMNVIERPALSRQDTRHKLNIKNKKSSDKSIGVELMDPEAFWREHLGGAKDEIEWVKFEETFGDIFKTQLEQMLDASELEWLFGILKREMEVEEDGILYKFNLQAFCNIDGLYQPLWERVFEQASESFAMNKVFDMDSSVRVEAIENLGKYRSAAVIDALRDLLVDADANVRAVATISLARTEAKDPVTIKFLMKTLNDKDRLVREAGCLALGHLQAKQSVNKLLHMWRNDVISHVREAANVALSQIGGDEVEKAMRVTKVLADEIRKLTTS